MATYEFTIYEDGVRTLRSIEDTQIILNVEDGSTAAGSTGDTHAAVVTGNPHNTTAADVGAVALTAVGAVSGVASLGVDGLVPTAQLPPGLGEDGFATIAVTGQTSVAAATPGDTLTLVAGSNVTLTTNAGSKSVTIASSAPADTSNAFGNIVVSGQSTVVADSASDTMTLVAGSNITITTNATTDTITIAASLAAAALAREGAVATATGNGTIGLNESAIIFTGASTSTGTLTTTTTAKKISVVNHGTANYTIVPGAAQTLNGGNITLVPGTAICLVRDESNNWWTI